jgi:hypothetical protein
MGSAQFEITRSAADRLELKLSGDLDEATMQECHSEARATLSHAKPGALRILVDLLDVEGYSLAARDELVALQRFLGTKSSQTAFVTGCPKGRSLALWLSHMASGQVIKSFAQGGDAIAWLAGSAGPTTGVRLVSRLSDQPEPGRPRRRTASRPR